MFAGRHEHLLNVTNFPGVLTLMVINDFELTKYGF